jgi:hypothetical protein
MNKYPGQAWSAFGATVLGLFLFFAVGNPLLSQVSYTPYSFTTLAGVGNAGPGSRDGSRLYAEFSAPSGLVFDNLGNIYVSDSGNNTVRKIAVNGMVTTLAGAVGVAGNTDGTGVAAQFHWRPTA